MKRKLDEDEAQPTQNVSYNMFASDSDDENLEESKSTHKVSALEIDDCDGYYLVKNGEVIGRNLEYKILGSIGRGVFSNVVLCEHLTSKTSVAIKIIRNNSLMHTAGLSEISFLHKVNSLQTKNTFIVKLLDHFEFKNHLCLVFEPLKLNLREILHQFGKNVGLNLSAVKLYAKQLLTALSHLAKLNIVHADFKLDNILVSEKMGMVKLCDFGSAIYENDPLLGPTPYLVSRYYRAPEIMLGLRYSHKIDIWALACCLYELFSGKVMFPGSSTNEMLKLIQLTKGKFSVKLIKKHLASYLILHKLPHFDVQSYKFLEFVVDPTSESIGFRPLPIHESQENFVSNRLLQSGLKNEEERNIRLFSNLIDHCLTLDVQKRYSAETALAHNFFAV